MTPSVGRFCFLLASALLACSCQTVGESTIDAREPKGVGNEVVNSIGMKFVRVPKGTFAMGSPRSNRNADLDEQQQVAERGFISQRDLQIREETLLARQQDRFVIEYPCDASTEPRWFVMRASRMPEPLPGFLISHANITRWHGGQTVSALT